MRKIRSSAVLPILLLFTSLAWGQHEGSMTGSRVVNKDAGPLRVLEGNDPVLLSQGSTVRGKEAYSSIYEGYEYLFASAANKEAFENNPSKHAVQLKGNCPVARAKLNREIKGAPEIYSVHQGQIYLFANQEAKTIFDQNPEQYLESHSAKPTRREGSGSN